MGTKVLHITTHSTLVVEEEDMADCLVQTLNLQSATQSEIETALSTGGPIRVLYNNAYYAIKETKRGFLVPDLTQATPAGYGANGVWLIGRDEVSGLTYLNTDTSGALAFHRTDVHAFCLTYLSDSVQVYHNLAPVRLYAQTTGLGGALNISKVITGMLPPDTRIVPDADENPSVRPQLAFVTKTSANSQVNAFNYNDFDYPTGSTVSTYFQSFNGVCYAPCPYEIVNPLGTRWAKIQA